MSFYRSGSASASVEARVDNIVRGRAYRCGITLLAAGFNPIPEGEDHVANSVHYSISGGGHRAAVSDCFFCLAVDPNRSWKEGRGQRPLKGLMGISFADAKQERKELR